MPSPVSSRAFHFGLLLIATVAPLAAQTPTTGTIEGQVTEAGSGRPIPGAQVYLGNSPIGAIATAAGSYRIPNVPPGTVEVRTRFIGYSPISRQVRVVAGQVTRVDLELSVSALQLETVVTTGTGQAVATKQLGNTVAVIEPPRVAPINSTSELLQGREPGLVGLPSGGLTGEGSRIRIRGNASLSMSNEPIILVDGVRMDAAGGFGDNVGAGGGGVPSRLDDIDPASIERIEVLKGAAAATLYGTEASNGVIQIFTKKGSVSAPRWEFQVTEEAVTYPNKAYKPNVGFARDTAQANRLGVFYYGPNSSQRIQPFELIENNTVTDLFETGRASTYSAAVSGGNPVVTYFASARYVNENGPFGAENLGFARDRNRRIAGTVNLGLIPFDDLRLGVRAGYTDMRHQTPNNNNNIYGVASLAMFGKPELANCRESMTSATDPTFGVVAPRTCRGPGNPTGQIAFATVREALQVDTRQDASRFIGGVDARYTPWSSISFTGTFGVDVTNQRSFEFAPFGYNVDNFTSNRVTGDRSIDDRNNREVTVDLKGNWNTNFSPTLSSALVVGGQVFISETEVTGGNNFNFPGAFGVVPAGASPTIAERRLSYVNGGYFAQEQLGWREWVFLTLGGRYDYASTFGENAGGVFYPKASISVIPSDLPGWSSSRLSTWRVRAAVGKSGRQPGAFDKLTTYGPLTSQFGPGAVPGNLGNADLRPEVATEIETGMELGLFEDVIGLDFTLWHRVVKDALVSRQFPISWGFQNQQLVNAGELEAKGAEVSLRTFVLRRANMTLDLFANGAYLWQRVNSLGGAPPLKVGGAYPRYRNFLKEGHAPGALFGAKLPEACGLRPAGATYTCLNTGQLPYDLNRDGQPDTEAQLLAALAAPINPNNLNPIMVDEDRDGDLLDHYLGKPYPNWTGSFGGTFGYRGAWRLATLFEYKAGDYTVTNLTDAFRRSNPSIGRNTREAAQVEATLLNPASTAQQRLEAARKWAYELKALSPYDGLNQNEDGSFVRWREVVLTWTVPARLTQRIGGRDMEISLTGRNLKLWTNYTGIDPEANAVGRTGAGGLDNNYLDAVDAFGFPLPRRFGLSVRLGY